MFFRYSVINPHNIHPQIILLIKLHFFLKSSLPFTIYTYCQTRVTQTVQFIEHIFFDKDMRTFCYENDTTCDCTPHSDYWHDTTFKIWKVLLGGELKEAEFGIQHRESKKIDTRLRKGRVYYCIKLL